MITIMITIIISKISLSSKNLMDRSNKVFPLSNSIGRRHLGILLVSSPNLLPAPAARIIAFFIRNYANTGRCLRNNKDVKNLY